MLLWESTSSKFDEHIWGIEGETAGNVVGRILVKDANAYLVFQTNYYFRRLPYSPEPGPAKIDKVDGTPIRFGRGTGGKAHQLLFEELLNLHLSVGYIWQVSRQD
jgi:hypothetical protein